MKVDFKTLGGGIVLVAAIPLLMLWQSGNTSKGTGPGKSKYIEYHRVSELTSHLYNGNTQALHMFCVHTLGRRKNPRYTATWIEDVAARCGECSDVHLARAWLFGFLRDANSMQMEFDAARRSARDEAELARVNSMIDRVMR